ncbi:phenylacetate--CoA ligase family protein [Actinomadura sp. 7K507]|uniref:phenylacetate--CoA ligase family protein n=1 Tax=Actinomadura sp. 7K507 TaxID=2530365 RepID=UPI001051F89E|nr:phenylacetate--CoA ligase family protein [Actinomadura sp. 7K507]TDC86431.1 phenylacetate--CoA ligase family protein [Actinomadura sp. 7K507]
MSVHGVRDASYLRALDEARFAYEKTSAYRALIDDAGVDIEKIDEPARFRSLPLTDKHYYRANYPAGVTTSETPLSSTSHVLISHSSGTGGDRLTTGAYTYDLATRMASTTSVHPPFKKRLLGARSQRVARYAAPNCSDVECAVPQTTIESRTLRDGTLVLPVGHDLWATPDSMVDQAIEEIETYGADWFYTDATHFSFLLRQYQAREKPPPKASAVVLTYTLATQVARRQIRAAMPADVPISEVVSMSELGWVAMECPQGRLHLNSRSFYVELLDPGTWEPVDRNEVGELVVTSIKDRLLPHLRYRTGDLYRWMADCPCGHPFPTVRHEGRATHYLHTPSGRKISPKEVDDLVGPDEGVIVYRINQHASDRFRFRYVPDSAAPSRCGTQLCERVREALGPGAKLEAEPVDYIPSERTGKFLACVRSVRFPEEK